MARHEDIGGVSALVRHTAGMAELAINAGHPDRKHNEYLPYPDDNFNDIADDRNQTAGKFTLGHVLDKNGRTFVPNLAVHIKSIVAERSYAGFSQFFNPYLYCITAVHGAFEWTIYKRYRDFNDLHKALVQFVEAETKRSITDLERNPEDDNETPCFPTRSDRMAFITDQIVRERCQILREYLNAVLKHPKFRHHPSTREFFDVSCLSFVRGLSVSIKEGYLSKRSRDDYRGHNIFLRLPFFCDACKFHHGKKWFVMKDSYITYIRPDTFEVRFPMLVDRGFEMNTGFRHAGTTHGIKITNLQRSLVMKCRNKRDCDEWAQHFINLREQAKQFADSNRFSSFAPIRKDQLAYWFVNGKSYMESIAKALLTAKEEVFITDWWLSPEIMLVRPADDERFRLDNLLGEIADKGVRVYVLVFKEVAFAMGLNSLHTKRALIGKSKRGFIKVIRHPDHYPSGGVFLWSHHEKTVVIDQKIAFVGGIDLCFGRWDDEFMRIVDLGEDNDRNLKTPDELQEERAAAAGRKETVEAAEMVATEMAENAGENPPKSSDQMKSTASAPHKGNEDVDGSEHSHTGGVTRVSKMNPKKWFEAKLSENQQGSPNASRARTGKPSDRISWKRPHENEGAEIEVDHGNDGSRLTRLLTTVHSQQSDEARRTSQWRQSNMTLARSRSLQPAEVGQGDHRANANANHLNAPSARRFRSQKSVQPHEPKVFDDEEESVRQRQKYTSRWRRLAHMMKKNSGSGDSEDEEKPEESTPSTVLDTKHRYFIGKDYSNSYEKDFEFLEKYSEDYIDRKTVPRMPWHDEALVVFGQAARDVARHFIQRWNIHKCEKFLYNDSYPFLLPKAFDDPEDLRVKNWKDFLDGRPYHVDAQCVRSGGPWSLGTRTIENSIQNAYLQMIDAAQHFIYLENQFFITTANDAVVRNQLAEAFFRRILRAHTEKETFRVYIVLPLLPGFDNVNAVQAVLYFIMRSISKGDCSLFKRLEKAGVNPHEFISFYGMRTHDILMGALVTEIIYVHSKLMIIDDRMAICGSANINDRSLLGQRDSEVGFIINDRDHEDAQMNGEPVHVGKFCSSWRKRLFSMLLGIQFDNPKGIDVSDPVSDQFYHFFQDVARNNTKIYEEVFSTLPTDTIRRFDQVGQYTETPKLKDIDPFRAAELLKGIQGLVVEYPLYFLDDENYLPSLRTPEGLVPNAMWT